MSEADALRAANIANNNAYLEELGFVASEGQRSDNNSNRTTDKPGSKRGVPVIATIQRQSARFQRKPSPNVEYKCDKCNITKRFKSPRALNCHRSFCYANPNYKPKWAYILTESERQQMTFHSSDEIDNSDVAEPKLIDFNQSIYEEQIDDDYDNDDDTKANDQNDGIINPITEFEKSQVKLCKFLYGDHYLECKTYDQMILAVQNYYKRPQISRKLNAQCAYNFSVEAGLSRKLGTKLLHVIKMFKPVLPVPRSIQGIESSVKKNVQRFQDCSKFTIPWTKKWKMNELKGFHSVKIYIRNVFEVLSHMLIDPEIMFVWKEHFHLSYHQSKDRDNNQVYSDVMTSNWAKESEDLVRIKDNEGYLMPLMFYTDGVQVSANVHNKITPVVITLGNFSDTLLQKDISKRVIAYLPNFKSYSKDLMISHIMAKLKISKTKVTSF